MSLNSGIKVLLKNRKKNHPGRTIVVVSNYYPPVVCGGAEIIAHKQARTLLDKGFNVIVFAPDAVSIRPEGKVYLEFYEEIPVIRYAVSEKHFDTEIIHFYDAKMNETFSELMDAVNPAVVHCHNLTGLSMGIIDVAKAKGAKVFVTLHDNWGFCYRNTCLTPDGSICTDFNKCRVCRRSIGKEGVCYPMDVRRSYFRRVFEKVDGFISPSNYTAQNYIKAGFNPSKMHVISNGLEIDRFKETEKINRDRFVVTYVGTMARHKGVDVLLKAIAYLDDPEIELILVGDGPEVKPLSGYAKRLGIDDQVIFAGRVDNDNIKEVYEYTDVYCLPSRWPENQPVSITEAMACGVAVVASDMGGNSELVKDCVTGYLFKNEDYKDLAEKIRVLKKKPGLCETFGRAGRMKMLYNDFSNQVDKIISLYNAHAGEYCESRKILAFVGDEIPSNLCDITEMDVIDLNWIEHPADKKLIGMCLLMPGAQLPEKWKDIPEDIIVQYTDDEALYAVL